MLVRLACASSLLVVVAIDDDDDDEGDDNNAGKPGSTLGLLNTPSGLDWRCERSMMMRTRMTRSREEWDDEEVAEEKDDAKRPCGRRAEYVKQDSM